MRSLVASLIATALATLQAAVELPRTPVVMTPPADATILELSGVEPGLRDVKQQPALRLVLAGDDVAEIAGQPWQGLETALHALAVRLGGELRDGAMAVDAPLVVHGDRTAPFCTLSEVLGVLAGHHASGDTPLRFTRLWLAVQDPQGTSGALPLRVAPLPADAAEPAAAIRFTLVPSGFERGARAEDLDRQWLRRPPPDTVALTWRDQRFDIELAAVSAGTGDAVGSLAAAIASELLRHETGGARSDQAPVHLRCFGRLPIQALASCLAAVQRHELHLIGRDDRPWDGREIAVVLAPRFVFQPHAAGHELIDLLETP